MSKTLLILATIILSTNTYANCIHSPLLSESQCQAIDELIEQKYAVIVKNYEVSGELKTLVMLGEAHIKPVEFAETERAFTDLFNLRLLEGHLGTGEKNSSFENKLLYDGTKGYSKIQEVMSAEKELFAQSTIHYAREQGLHFMAATGDVFLNNCLLGQVQEGDFYSSANLDTLISSSKPSDTMKFFGQFSKNLKTMKTVRKITIHGEYYSPRVPVYKKHCSPEELNFDRLSYVSFNIESGKKSQWKDYCPSLLCGFDKKFQETALYGEPPVNSKTDRIKEYMQTDEFKVKVAESEFKPMSIFPMIASILFFDVSDSGVPGIRELFMADNIFEVMKQTDDVGLVIVGAAHLGFLNHAFSQYSESDSRSTWEVAILKEYKK